ncbi:NUDIX hydrolase [Cupriavidus metallidurans]|uniref:NUDIX hydrolase n=1 Tax=Cupriavidus metallidurans TaxID=119219 RepID=UPI003CFDD051
MISFNTDRFRFDLRAAAILIRGGYVLLHRVETDTFWSLPGGRVELGEEATHAVAREMREELGVASEVERLLFAVENFFENEGKPHHELGLYFAISVPDDSHIVDVNRDHIGMEDTKRLVFRWFRRRELGNVELYPEFLREALQEDFPGIKHIVQRG